MKRLLPLVFLAAAAACGQPGVAVNPATGDFAFVEAKLQG